MKKNLIIFFAFLFLPSFSFAYTELPSTITDAGYFECFETGSGTDMGYRIGTSIGSVGVVSAGDSNDGTCASTPRNVSDWGTGMYLPYQMYFVTLYSDLTYATSSILGYVRIYHNEASMVTTGWQSMLAPDVSGDTRIVAVDPLHNSTVLAGSYNMSATVYVPSEQFSDGEYLHVQYSLNKKGGDFYAADIFDLAGENVGAIFDIEIPSSSFHVLASSTVFGIEGRYTAKWEIRKPNTTIWGYVSSLFGLLGDNSILVTSTTTSFVVGQLNAFDVYVASTTEMIASSTSRTKPFNSTACSLSTFVFSDCIGLIFGWSPYAMNLVFTDFKNTVLTYAPFGYVTRTLAIFAQTATSTPPDLTLSYADPSLSGMASSSVTLGLWTSFEQSQGMLDSVVSKAGTPKTLREIVEPWLLWVIGLAILFIILRDLGMTGYQIYHEKQGSHLFGKGGKREGVTNDEYRYKEWLWKNK